jgi:hypothetical protein
LTNQNGFRKQAVEIGYFYFNLIPARKNVADSRKYGWSCAVFDRGASFESDLTVETAWLK